MNTWRRSGLGVRGSQAAGALYKEENAAIAQPTRQRSIDHASRHSSLFSISNNLRLQLPTFCGDCLSTRAVCHHLCLALPLLLSPCDSALPALFCLFCTCRTPPLTRPASASLYLSLRLPLRRSLAVRSRRSRGALLCVQCNACASVAQNTPVRAPGSPLLLSSRPIASRVLSCSTQ